jgi:hypothetical protein
MNDSDAPESEPKPRQVSHCKRPSAGTKKARGATARPGNEVQSTLLSLAEESSPIRRPKHPPLLCLLDTTEDEDEEAVIVEQVLSPVAALQRRFDDAVTNGRVYSLLDSDDDAG